MFTQLGVESIPRPHAAHRTSVGNPRAGATANPTVSTRITAVPSILARKAETHSPQQGCFSNMHVVGRRKFARRRLLRFFSISLLCLALMIVVLVPARAQSGFDRPGGDYARFVVPSGDPAVCAARCDRDVRCRAWAFSYPGTSSVGGSTAAICWLKNKVTPRVENSSSVSGVKGAGLIEMRPGPVETSIDRTGGDYRHFDLASDPTGQSCKKVCEDDNRCRAWTYVRPGYLGPQARCYLKDRITPPRRKPCCLSGVVR
jgi:hypothetical protein